MSSSIYEQIGGAEAVSAVVTELDRRLVVDSITKGWFDGMDMDLLSRHQRAFITAALGGPDHYAGRSLAAAHAPLGITDEGFDQLAVHLDVILVEFGIEHDLILQIMQAVEGLRGDVVTA